MLVVIGQHLDSYFDSYFWKNWTHSNYFFGDVCLEAASIENGTFCPAMLLLKHVIVLYFLFVNTRSFKV